MDHYFSRTEGAEDMDYYFSRTEDAEDAETFFDCRSPMNVSVCAMLIFLAQSSLLRRDELHGMTQGTHENISCVPCGSLHSQFSIFNFQFSIFKSHRFAHGYRYSCRLDKSCFAR